MHIPNHNQIRYNPKRKDIRCKVLSFQNLPDHLYNSIVTLTGFYAWYYAGVGNGYMVITLDNTRIWIRGDNLLPV